MTKSWFENMSDIEINTYLLELSEKSISAMKNGSKELALSIHDEMNSKVDELKEHIVNIKGFYIGFPLYDYYQQMIIDLNSLKNDTLERLIVAHKKNNKK